VPLPELPEHRRPDRLTSPVRPARDLRRRWAVAVPLGLYLALAVTALLVWDADDRHELNGDEPHYLVVASAIAHDGTFENTAAYAREFRTREIHRVGLAAPDATPAPANTHAVAGPHGLYNVHGVGLPVLLAAPLAAGGVLAAKLAMIALNSAIVWVGWAATGLFTERTRARVWATSVAAITAPFVFAAGQVYPDVLAGSIVLCGLCRFAALPGYPRARLTAATAGLLAVAPWLQIKFAGAALLIGIALAWRGYLTTRSRAQVIAVAAPLLASAAALAFYNWYAFGRVTGPYGDEAVEPGGRGAMVLAGLHVDVNQGWVWQAPVWLVGVAALGAMIARRQAVGVLTLATYLVLLVPNALHPNWYGGDSLSGRFFWTAAAVLLLPTVAGLLVLERNYRPLAAAVTLVAAGAFVWQYADAVLGDAVLVRRSSTTMARDYPIHWGPFGHVMPKLYAVGWAWAQPVTWAALAIVPAALWIGLSGPRGRYPWVVRAGPLALVAGVTLGLGTAVRAPDRSEFELARLSHQVGAKAGAGWSVDAGSAGFMTYGALLTLGDGNYEARLEYRSDGAAGTTIGTTDVLRWPQGGEVAALPVPGTEGAWHAVRVPFRVDAGRSLFEFRLHSNGLAAVELADLTVVRLD
jgi:hypothetical protein